MKTITFNNADWSGGKTVLDYNEDTMEFNLNDINWKLHPKLTEDGGKYYEVWGDEWDECLFKVYDLQDTCMAVSGDYTRESRNPIVAAAQMILFTV